MKPAISQQTILSLKQGTKVRYLDVYGRSRIGYIVFQDPSDVDVEESVWGVENRKADGHWLDYLNFCLDPLDIIEIL